MATEVHVDGRVALGRFADFVEAVGRYRSYAHAHGYAVPRVLQGLSGDMNSVRMIFAYPDLGAFEADEARVAADREYARVALEMPYVEGTLHYTIFREIPG